MLILCNRRLLRQQYGFELADYYDCYRELIAGVDVLTYQVLAEKSSDYQVFQRVLKEYEMVVCDEAHYFYGDSDFNSVGTYSLLQKIILACFYKCIIMITATFSEVKPLIEKTYKKCAEKLSQKENIGIHFSQFRYCNDIYDFQSWCDYSRLTCLYTYDVETVVEEIANSEKKTLVFIDDKQKAEAFKKMLIKTNGVKDMEVFMLNAQVMDERIHDEDVGNIVIATDSRVSFIQMVGRIRAESTRQCNLYIYPRDFRYCEKQISQYEEKMRWYEELEEGNLNLYALDLLRYGWIGKDEKAEFLRNALVITACNEALLQTFAAEFRAGSARINSVVRKKPEEFCILDSSYQVKREEELRKTLLQIQEFSLEQLSKMKTQPAKEFRKDLLKDTVKKDGSFSKEKLQDICADLGLYLEATEGKDKKNRYTVKEKA